jgi:gliding motility-associated-like protein
MRDLQTIQFFLTYHSRFTKNVKGFWSRTRLFFIPFLFMLTGQNLLAQPSKPGNLYVLSCDGQNEVHWSKTGSPDMLEYRIYRSDDSAVFHYIGKVPSADSTFIDKELPNNKFYFYYVTSVNKGGKESEYSNTDASAAQKDLSYSLGFDGNKSCLIIDDNKILNLKSTSSFSIEFWVKFIGANANGCIISRQNIKDATPYYQVKVSSGKFIFSLNGVAMESSSGVVPILTDAWYHLACTYQYNSNTDVRPLTVYVNGQMVGSWNCAAGPKEENKNSVLIFGAERDSKGNVTNGFSGLMKEIRLWNYPLTATEIPAKMNVLLRGDETGMLGLWHCNGRFNHIVYDYSSLGNNAVVLGNVHVVNSDGQPVNHAPIVIDCTRKPLLVLSDSIKAGKTKQICLKVTDQDGDSVWLSKASSINRNGVVKLCGTCFSYTSSADFSGIDPFLLVIADNGKPVMYDTLQVYMNVYPSNTPPVIVNTLGQSVQHLQESIDQDSTKQFCLNVKDKEQDSVSIYSIRSLGNHSKGILIQDKKMCFNIIPESRFFGQDSLRIIVSDHGTPVMYDTVIISLNVLRKNRAPQILNPLGFPADFIYKTVHKEPLQMCIFIDDLDDDSTAIVSGKSINGKGSITVSEIKPHCFTYIPKQDATGEDTTMIIARDFGVPAMYDTVKVIFTIVPENFPPVIVDEKNNAADTLKYATNEGEPLEICLNITDTNGDRDSISNVGQMSDKNNARIDVLSNTCINYQPAANFIGPDELLVRVSDKGEPVMSDSVIVLINVKPKITISHALSPDGDGINDQWQIDGIEKYPNNTITIFNQWGDVVYKVSGYDNQNVAWKGETKGGSVHLNKEVPNGTYFYIIDISGAKPTSGFIVIKR